MTFGVFFTKTLCLKIVSFIIISNKQVSFSGSKIYVEIQVFDSLSESLSSGVGCFFT